MGVSKYIYTVYDAKTGDFVAKGTAAQLAGKGLFKDAGTVSTCYRSSRKTDKPRRWRMERAEAAAPMPEPVPTADNTQQRRVYWYRAWNSAGELLGEGTAMDLVALGVFSVVFIGKKDFSVLAVYGKKGFVVVKDGIFLPFLLNDCLIVSFYGVIQEAIF